MIIDSNPSLATPVSRRVCRPSHGSGPFLSIPRVEIALSTLPLPSFSSSPSPPQEDSPDPNLEFRSEQTHSRRLDVVCLELCTRLNNRESSAGLRLFNAFRDVNPCESESSPCRWDKVVSSRSLPLLLFLRRENETNIGGKRSKLVLPACVHSSLRIRTA